MNSNYSLPKDHILRKSLWIWPLNTLYLTNCYADFRKDFNLCNVPAKAPFYITADKAYKLYVNGIYICRGPARGFQETWAYDEVDIGPYLQEKHNWISIQAYNPGIGTFQYIHKSIAGMLCGAEWEDFSIVSDLQWLMRRSPGHIPQTARYSVQLDFQEFYDARNENNDWIYNPNLKDKWSNRSININGEPTIEDVRKFRSSAPFGQPPWENIEARGIPLMSETLIAPHRVEIMGTGINSENYIKWQNISWGIYGDLESINYEEDAPSLQMISAEKGFIEFEIPPSSSIEKFTAISLKMPRYAVGNLVVETKCASGGEVLDFQYVELINEHGPVIPKPGNACNIALGNRLILKKGKTLHEFFHILGFGGFLVLARKILKPLKIKISVRASAYPFSMRGYFKCSDKTLNEIHDICRHTQKICSLDAYVDTPWREQAQWWGDARVQAKNTFYLDGDPRLLKRGITSISRQHAPQGLTFGHAPTVAYNCILPDFSLTWILTIWDYYWQTGECCLFIEQWPRIQKILTYFESSESVSSLGLLKHDKRFWLFEDWSSLFKGEIPSFLNLWYLYTLQHIVKLLKAATLTKEALVIEKKANMFQELIIKFLYSEENKLIISGLDKDLVRTPSFSIHDQTLALMTGILPDAHKNMISKAILPYLMGEKLEAALPSSFWSAYVIEEMAKRNYNDEVISFIRKKWKPMIKTGTTWEVFDWNPDNGYSISHAWSAHPSYHFVNIISGITQIEPAWQKIRFSPHFVNNLESAQSLIPTPKGNISTKWLRSKNGTEVKLSLPEGVAAEIDLPEHKKRIKGSGDFEFTLMS